MITIQSPFFPLTFVTCFAFRLTLSADLGEALEAPDLTWSTSPEAPWIVQSEVSFGTPSAVKATHHPDSRPGLGFSTFLKVETPGPGQLEFYYGSDDQFAGSAKFEVPGTFSSGLSTKAGSWKRKIRYLPNGEGTWVFHTSSGNTDSSFYLDRVKFFPETAPPILFTKGKIDIQILFEEIGIGRFLEISAIPDEGWEFHGWIGDLETDSPIIQVWYNAELELIPLVQKTFDYSGFEVTSVTSGGDEPWEIVDGKLVPGILAGGLQESRASFEFEESGVFTFTMTGEESSGPYFSIRLNDRPIKPQLVDIDSNRYQILIPLSGADLEFELEWGNTSAARGVYISDLAFRSGVAVSLEADGRGSVSISPPGEIFQLGDLVTLHVEPEPGHFFAGWITEHPFPIPTNESFQLRNFLEAKAIFLPNKFSNFQLYGSGILTPADSTNDEFVLSTENNDKEFGPGGIESEIQAPATLYLDFKYEEARPYGQDAELEVLKNDNRVERLWAPVGVWQSYVYDLEGSDICTLQIGANATLNQGQIGFRPQRQIGYYKNIRIDSGYRINLEAENGTVFKLPEKNNYSLGEFVTLNAVPDPGYEFIQWLGKDFLSEDSQAEFQVQDHATVTAYFGSYLDDSDKSWLSWGNPGWQEVESQDSSNNLEFNLKNKTLLGPSISGLRAKITGPGILNFEYLLGSNSTQGGLSYSVRIGQKKYVLSRATSEDWLPFSAVIPDGEQPIEFILEYYGTRERDTEFAIRSLKFQSGYGLELTTFGGNVAITGENPIYSPGELVSLTAEAGDLPFILWSGDAVLKDSHLEITMNGPKSLQAHFGEVFEIQGESFFTSGPRLWEKETGSNLIGIRLDPGETAAISILPQSAGTIVYDIQGDNPRNELVVSQTINGKTTDFTGFPPFNLVFEYPLESSYFDDSNQVQFIFENRSETNELNVSFELLELNSGIQFNINKSSGGTLSSSHPTGRHPKGTVISLEATPDQGNRFSQWMGLPEVVKKKFELVLEEPTEITPIFTLDSWYPLPFETHDIFGNWYVTEVNDTSSALSIRADDFSPLRDVFALDAHVNGPGVLSFESVDFSHQPRYYRPYPFRKFVDAGLQEIRFNVRFYPLDWDPNLEFKNIRYQEGYYLGVPNWVERSFGPISVSPSNNVLVAPGQEVTLLAQPNENFKFVDWGPLVGSSENPVTVVIQDHMEIIPTIVPKDFAAGVKTHLSHSDILVSYSANEGPNNSPSIKYKSTGEEGFQIELELLIPQEPGYFKFSWRLNSDQGLALLIVPEEDYQFSRVDLENVNGEWEEDGFFITQDVLNDDGNIIIRAFIPSGSEFELGSFEFTPGFRLFPSVKGGAFTVSPEQMVYDESETITLTAIPDDPSMSFIGWVGDRALNDRISKFTITKDTELTGFFGKAIDFEGPGSDLRFFTSLLPEWRSEINEWSSEIKITVQREENTLLSLPLDGPGLFEWERKGVRSNSWSVFLDGEKVDLKALLNSYIYRISIPEGRHTIRWFNPGQTDGVRWDYRIVSPTYQTGFVLDLRTPVGIINLNPFKPVYEPGDEVEVTLSLPGDVQFVDWSGDLVGFPDSFTLNIDNNIYATALTKDTLKFGGQIWQYDGYSWTVGSTLTSDTDVTGGTPTITTQIKGPSTVFFSGSAGNASPPSALIYLDDEVEKSFPVNGQINSSLLNVPDGNHILKIVNENGRFILSDFVVYPVQPDWEWISFIGGDTDGEGAFPSVVYNKLLDSDGDSIPNYFEFVFQKDPFVRDLEKIIELVPSIESLSSEPFVRLGKLPRNLGNGESLSIELSTDLENWEVLLEINAINLPNLAEPLMLPVSGYIPSVPLFARLRTFP